MSDYEHDHSHQHDHRSGPLDWLRQVYGHSHDTGHKIDRTVESNEHGIRALKVSFVVLGFTALLQFAIVIVSHSVALLADTVHNFADAATSLPLWVAFMLARRAASRRFTYGFGKIEDVAGVVIVAVIFSSACVAGYEALERLLYPQPIEHFGAVAVAAIIGLVGNEAVAVLRIRVGREIGSAALVADGQHSRVDGFTSLGVLVGVIGSWLGAPIVDPLVGLAIAAAIFLIVREAASSVWTHLIEGIEPEIIEEIEHAPTHVAGVRDVRHVRARWVGHKVHGDLEVGVDPGLRIHDADRVAKAVEEALLGHVDKLGEIVVRIRSLNSAHDRADEPYVHEHEHRHNELHRHRHEDETMSKEPHTHWHRHESSDEVAAPAPGVHHHD